MFGNIVSLVIAVALAGVMSLFFIKKRMFALLAVYLSFRALLITVYILSWYSKGFEFGLWALLAGFVVFDLMIIVVHANDFKALFFRLKNREHANDGSFSDDELQRCIEEIVKACQTMSKARTGALIVIAPTRAPQQILNTGIRVEAVTSAPLLESVFNTKAPMHDGAVIIKGNKVLSAGCFLPLTQQNISKDLGTRHRAAIGITEETDNVCVVVSEENGIISVAKKGALRRFITPERLSDILYETFNVNAKSRFDKR